MKRSYIMNNYLIKLKEKYIKKLRCYLIKIEINKDKEELYADNLINQLDYSINKELNEKINESDNNINHFIEKISHLLGILSYIY